MWSRQESNLYLKFRKLLFYPLNYGTIHYAYRWHNAHQRNSKGRKNKAFFFSYLQFSGIPYFDPL
jgi:hypothetical protein